MRHCSGLPFKAKALKALLTSKDLSFLMEAHNGLSARIVEEAGFKAIWASGLSISAQMGLRDSNEASWTQVCAVAEMMSDATAVPILIDADTGYGSFNNARMLVRKLEKIGVAGACVEDKLFPKTNSLLDTKRAQPLADMAEFALKIRAMKDTQTDDNFCVVARVESFIAGWPVEEALRRATAYAEAGADAVLIHSKRADSSDIDAFMAHWDKSLAPVVIVPTKYPAVPMSHFTDLGISSVIWANHNLRSSITAMQETTREIFEKQSLVDVEARVAPVKEVFRLQRLQELQEAEERFLPRK